MSQKGIQTCFSKLCLILPWQNTTTTTQHQWHPANDQCSLHRTSHSINICQFHTKNKTLDSNSCQSAKLHRRRSLESPVPGTQLNSLTSCFPSFPLRTTISLPLVYSTSTLIGAAYLCASRYMSPKTSTLPSDFWKRKTWNWRLQPVHKCSARVFQILSNLH